MSNPGGKPCTNLSPEHNDDNSGEPYTSKHSDTQIKVGSPDEEFSPGRMKVVIHCADDPRQSQAQEYIHAVTTCKTITNKTICVVNYDIGLNNSYNDMIQQNEWKLATIHFRYSK